jgi:hypothetical protein
VQVGVQELERPDDVADDERVHNYTSLLTATLQAVHKRHTEGLPATVSHAQSMAAGMSPSNAGQLALAGENAASGSAGPGGTAEGVSTAESARMVAGNSEQAAEVLDSSPVDSAQAADGDSANAPVGGTEPAHPSLMLQSGRSSAERHHSNDAEAPALLQQTSLLQRHGSQARRPSVTSPTMRETAAQRWRRYALRTCSPFSCFLQCCMGLVMAVVVCVAASVCSCWATLMLSTCTTLKRRCQQTWRSCVHQYAGWHT